MPQGAAIAAHLVRIVHRAGGVGVAAAGQAEILAMRLADDGAAGIEDTGHDGGVDVRHIARDWELPGQAATLRLRAWRWCSCWPASGSAWR